jgi:hypothetical protein
MAIGIAPVTWCFVALRRYMAVIQRESDAAVARMPQVVHIWNFWGSVLFDRPTGGSEQANYLKRKIRLPALTVALWIIVGVILVFTFHRLVRRT